MRNRKVAALVGVLYIIGTVSGILGIAFTQDIFEAQDYLSKVYQNDTPVIIGSFFIFIMGLSLAMIPVMMYPILKKHNERLALGYVVFRSGLEAICHISIVISWLFLLPLSKVYMSALAENQSDLNALGSLLVKGEEISSILAIVFCFGCFMFYYVLYKSRIVPRWVSGWGLIAVLPYLASGILVMFDVISPLSTLGVVSNLPLALQEMVLAVWLIAKGFNQNMSDVFKPSEPQVIVA